MEAKQHFNSRKKLPDMLTKLDLNSVRTIYDNNLDQYFLIPLFKVVYNIFSVSAINNMH